MSILLLIHTDVSIHPDSFNSDHFPVSFVINAKFKRKKNVNSLFLQLKKGNLGGGLRSKSCPLGICDFYSVI